MPKPIKLVLYYWNRDATSATNTATIETAKYTKYAKGKQRKRSDLNPPRFVYFVYFVHFVVLPPSKRLAPYSKEIVRHRQGQSCAPTVRHQESAP